MPTLPFALQLYTVRDHMEKDPIATLREVKAAGYDSVELAGLAGHSAAQFKAILDDIGLTPSSAHIGYEELVGDIDQAIADCKALGITYAVVPWVGAEMCPDKAAWCTAISQMDKAGAQLRAEGIRLCYHNHDHEFESLDGDVIFDLIFQNSAPENLAAELDTCWVTIGGADPVAILRDFGARCPLLHVKDYTPGDPFRFAEVGRGCMQWDAIFAAAQEIGVAWYVVEQDDHFATGSLDSARISAAYMAARQG